nr:hypothetical protein [Candidatus Parabeggiatoa sp.]
MISNHEQVNTNFENYKNRIINEAIGNTITDKMVFVPVEIKDTFLNWLKEKYQNVEWHPKETLSEPDIKIIGGDELNDFIKGMNVVEEWESVMKPQAHSKQTYTEAVRQFEDEKQQNLDYNDDQVDQTKEGNGKFDLPNILFVVVFIALVILAVYQLIDSQKNQNKDNITQAEKALVEGNFVQASESAKKVSDSYDKTMKIAIKEIERATNNNEPKLSASEQPLTHSKNNQLLRFLQNANDALQNLRLTTPANDNAVLWARNMLEIEVEQAYGKNILKKVIDKYLQIYSSRPQKLKQVLNMPVLPQKKLKNYATDEQRSRITQLLGKEYWSQ